MRCLALLSGGLDSMLAIRLMQEQGIEVEAVNFKTAFTCCQDNSARVAHKLGVRLTIVSAEDDYFDLVRHPQFGYGKGANPCIDCRIYMFKRAARLLPELDARFLVSGEVVGQRPKSQKKRDLEVIAHHANPDDLLLRPLSAKRLPPTLPERKGWVDRNRLYDFVGRSRQGLIKLARELGIEEIPSPSNGCALTEVAFSKKVFDLIQLQPQNSRWDFDLLQIGRHFRLDERTKAVIARNEAETEALRRMFTAALQTDDSSRVARLEPANFLGPDALVIGEVHDDALRTAAGLMLRYSRGDQTDRPRVIVETTAGRAEIAAEVMDAAQRLTTIAGA